jgi:hypothetical protein
MSSGPDTDLIDEIRAELIKQADPGRAPGMQAHRGLDLGRYYCAQSSRGSPDDGRMLTDNNPGTRRWLGDPNG